jgi:hypothetical protein
MYVPFFLPCFISQALNSGCIQMSRDAANTMVFFTDSKDDNLRFGSEIIDAYSSSPSTSEAGKPKFSSRIQRLRVRFIFILSENRIRRPSLFRYRET